MRRNLKIEFRIEGVSFCCYSRFGSIRWLWEYVCV